MNIDNINPVDPKRETGRNQPSSRARAEKPDRAESKKTTANIPTRTETPDSVIKSDETRLIESLTAAVGKGDEKPRQNVIDRARARMENGEYDTHDLLQKISSSLLKTSIL